MDLQRSSFQTKSDRLRSYGVTVFLWMYLATQHTAKGSTHLPFSLVTACDNPTTNNANNNIGSTNRDANEPPVLLFFLSTQNEPSSECYCEIEGKSVNVSHYLSKGGVVISSANAPPQGNNSTSTAINYEELGWQTLTTNKGAHSARGILVISLSSGDEQNEHGSYVFLLVQARNGSVTIQCDKIFNSSNSGTDEPISASTVQPTPFTSASAASHNTTTTKATTSSTKLNTNSQADESTPVSSTPVTGPSIQPANVDAESGREDNDHDDNNGMVILGSGAALMGIAIVVVAVVVIVCIVNTQKRRRKSSGDQTEKGPAPSSPKKRRRGKASSNGASTSGGAALGRSIDSLINDQHNYEEVSEDGISGDLPFAVTPNNRNQPDRKSSRKTSTRSQRNTNDYSHIKSGQPRPPPPNNAATPPIPSSSRPSTSGVHHGSDEDDYNELDLACSARQNSCKAPPKASTLSRTLPDVDDVEDDYNKLDLARSTRQNSCKAATATARTPATTFYVGDEDGDYMEVGDDIYEAVDNEVEVTPLCVRKATTGAAKSATEEAEYTDCASDGRLNPAFDLNGPGTAPPLLSSPNPAASSSPQKRPAPRNRNPAGLALPSLPTSPPPCKGLRRNRSRSVEHLNEKLEAVKAKRKAKGHKHTQSVDLSASSGDLCRQRDLFLDNFRSQGDGAEMTEAPGDSSDYAEVSGSNEGIALTDSTRNSPAASSTENPSSSPPTKPTGATPGKPGEEWGQVVLRKKSRNSQKKSMLEQPEGRLSMVDHLKVLNTGLLELESAVRHSMEIHEDELVMIDNVLYGTLPRNRSLPTTEL